jgi:general secretion pathway protein N
MTAARHFLSLTGAMLLGAIAIINERTTADAEPSTPAANPVRALSLTELSRTRERPIFSPSRRPPPPPAPIAIAPVAVRPPVKPREPERPPVSLVGTVIGTDMRVGVFLETATKNVVRLHIGEDHQGWVLRLIEAGEVTLVKDEQVAVIRLPPPGEASDGLPRVAAGVIPIVSNESYVDEQPRPARAPQRH